MSRKVSPVTLKRNGSDVLRGGAPERRLAPTVVWRLPAVSCAKTRKRYRPSVSQQLKLATSGLFTGAWAYVSVRTTLPERSLIWIDTAAEPPLGRLSRTVK